LFCDAVELTEDEAADTIPWHVEAPSNTPRRVEEGAFDVSWHAPPMSQQALINPVRRRKDWLECLPQQKVHTGAKGIDFHAGCPVIWWDTKEVGRKKPKGFFRYTAALRR